MTWLTLNIGLREHSVVAAISLEQCQVKLQNRRDELNFPDDANRYKGESAGIYLASQPNPANTTADIAVQPTIAPWARIIAMVAALNSGK